MSNQNSRQVDTVPKNVKTSETISCLDGCLIIESVVCSDIPHQ